MSIQLSLPPLWVVYRLQQAGYQAYLVGGAVRDLLLTQHNQQELSPDQLWYRFDYDLTTDATPEQIQQVFLESFYENEFGTVSLGHSDIVASLKLTPDQLPQAPLTPRPPKVIDLAQASKLHQSLVPPASAVSSSEPTIPDLQITTFRAGELYDDHRHPSSMKWGTSLQQDLERRDFTINALAIGITPEWLTAHLTPTHHSLPLTFQLSEGEYQLVDPFNGQQDLADRVVRAVGQPEARFREDALRILRAIRFSVQLNMSIADPTLEAVIALSQDITYISIERIRDEFLKILASSYPAEGIELLDQTGLLQHIIPELIATKGVEQAGHHTTDVWTHSLDALRHCPSSDPIVRLATLLHDIAKPLTFQRQRNTITFYNHEVIGARVAKKIALRLRLSHDQAERIFTLVRYHMFHYQPHNTDAAIRRFMRKVGLQNVDDILDLREADRLGSGARKTSWRLEEMKQRMIEQLHQPLDVTDLAINGSDLITELKLQPGPMIGKVLHTLFEEVLDDADKNTRDFLLGRAKRLIKSGGL